MTITAVAAPGVSSNVIKHNRATDIVIHGVTELPSIAGMERAFG
jgi:hypothetical protein